MSADASHFSPFYNTNYCPNDTELLKIKELLGRQEAELIQINSELVALQSAAGALRRRKRDIQAFIQPLRALSSGIRRLSEDILLEIFAFCIPSVPTFDPTQAPVLLTHVCQNWHSVALESSCMWAAFSIKIPFPKAPWWKPTHMFDFLTPNIKNALVAEAYLSEVDIWLARSHQHALSITLSQSDTRNASDDRHSLQTIDRLLHHTNRWKHINISVPVRVISELAKLTEDRVPILDSLSIDCISYSKLRGSLSEIPSWSKSGLLKAAKLRKVSLHRFDGDIVSLPVRWSQITSLSIHPQGFFSTPSLSGSQSSRSVDFSPLVACRLLSSCPNVIFCRLAFTAGVANVQPELCSFSPIILKRLRFISLHEGNSISTVLLDRLEAPVLKEIEFYTSRMPEVEDNPDISQSSALLIFLNKPGRQITKLTTDIRFFSYKQRIQLFDLLTAVSELRFQKYELTQSVLEPESPFGVFSDFELMLLSSSSHGCPNLETLECHSLSLVTDGEILRFLQARSEFPTAGKLKRLSISCGQNELLKLNIHVAIQRFRDAGLELELHEVM